MKIDGKAAQIVRPYKTITTNPAGFCIYCGSAEDLTNEHVSPYFLAGNVVIPKASCSNCSKITKRFEDKLAYTFFFALRRRLKLQSRSSGGPKDYQMFVEENGVRIERSVPFDQVPPVIPWPVFHGPGILMNHAPTNGLQA